MLTIQPTGNNNNNNLKFFRSSTNWEMHNQIFLKNWLLSQVILQRKI